MDDNRFELKLTGGEGYRFTIDFDMDDVEPLHVDEPPPLGEGDGPNPSRLLGAAVGSCLSASLLFCLRKARLEIAGVETTVEGEMVRNDAGRLRIGKMAVRVSPEMSEEHQKKMDRCLSLFEDFCVVTQSVRDGLDVDVTVEPRTAEG